jgi:hypothetical protein
MVPAAMGRYELAASALRDGTLAAKRCGGRARSFHLVDQPTKAVVSAIAVKRAKPGSFYHVPCSWPVERAKLRKVSQEDAHLVKMRRQIAAARKQRQWKPRRDPPAQGSLFS